MGHCVTTDGSLCVWWVTVWLMVHCVTDGSLCDWWVTVWLMGHCVTDGSLCDWWVTVWLMGHCVTDGSLCEWWVTVWVMGHCVTTDGSLCEWWVTSFKGWLSNQFVTKKLSKIPPHPKYVATLPCDLSLTTIHVSGCHRFLTLTFHKAVQWRL